MSDSTAGVIAGLLVLVLLLVCATGEQGKQVDRTVQKVGSVLLK